MMALIHLAKDDDMIRHHVRRGLEDARYTVSRSLIAS
jgi:hypothetical protein